MGRLPSALASAAVFTLAWSGAPTFAQAPQATDADPRLMARASSMQPTIAATDGGVIQGVVLDDRGEPLSGALVSAMGRTSKAVETDARGRFALGGLLPDEYVVRAHCLGFAASSRVILQVTPGSTLASSLVLRRLSQQRAGFGLVGTSGQASVWPAGLMTEAESAYQGEAGQEPLPFASQGDEDAESGETVDRDHAHDELSWRLRHLKRTVLRDVQAGTPVTELAASDMDAPEGYSAAMSAMARMASLFGSEVSGQLRLLTVGSFDGPTDLFSGDELAHGIAHVTIGAPTGEDGRWAVRGAITQGDLSSWFVGGSFTNEFADAHRVDLAMSYAMQRYAGGNAAALAAMPDGSRNVGTLYGVDRWGVSDRATLTVGTGYARYDYLDNSHLVSPELGAAYDLSSRTRLHASVAQRMMAPGAVEFVPPPVQGLWLPPERTFSSLSEGAPLRPQRSRHSELGIVHEVARGYAVGVRHFRQGVNDQLATLFDVRIDGEATPNLGHYYVASPGNVVVDGWAVSIDAEAGRVRGSVDYSVATARWAPSPDVDRIRRSAASAVRAGDERVHDVTTSVEARIPETATRVFVFYRVNTAFAQAAVADADARFDSRFDVRVQQGLPFMGFTNVDWELLLAVRNVFHEPLRDASFYDELLTVRPPKRLVGGVMVRF